MCFLFYTILEPKTLELVRYNWFQYEELRLQEYLDLQNTVMMNRSIRERTMH